MWDTSVFFTYSCILVYHTIQDETMFFVILNSNRLVSIHHNKKKMSFARSMNPWEICEGQSHGYLAYLHKSLFFFRWENFLRFNFISNWSSRQSIRVVWYLPKVNRVPTPHKWQRIFATITSKWLSVKCYSWGVKPSQTHTNSSHVSTNSLQIWLFFTVNWTFWHVGMRGATPCKTPGAKSA